MKFFLIPLTLLCFVSCGKPEIEAPLMTIQIQDRNGMTETVNAPDRIALLSQSDFLGHQPYKKVLRIYRKEGKSHSKITTYHPNGGIWQYLEAEEMRANGLYQEWFSNGQLRIEAQVIGGPADVSPGAQQDWLFDGISHVWDEQGHLLAKISYRQGRLDGNSIYYYTSGQIEKEVPFSNGSIEGELVEFYETGATKAKTQYRKGKKLGDSIGYFLGGQMAWEESYRDDLLLQGIYYDPQGIHISEVEGGIGFKAMYENDNKEFLAHLIQIRQGYAEGEVRNFSPKGDLTSIYHIKNGKKHGEEINYYSAQEQQDGKQEPLHKLSINWDQDKIHGSVKTWYNSGQIQSQREYSHNQKIGTSISWYRDGSLMLVEEYEANRLDKGQYYKRSGRDPVSSVINGNGVATLYDEQGIFLRKVTYVKGEAIDPE